MQNNDLRGYILAESKLRLRWLASSMLDAVFVVLWILLQWGANYIVEFFELSGLAHWASVLIRLSFAITPAVPISIHIYKNIRIMIMRTNLEIKRAEADEDARQPNS